MKVWLDDERTAPGPDWVHVYTPRAVCDLIERGGVTEISLDHDLGGSSDPMFYTEATGYDVLLWIEQGIVEGTLDPSKIPCVIHIHTSNTSAREKMRAARDSIRGRVRELGLTIAGNVVGFNKDGTSHVLQS